MERDSFVFYRSFYESVKELDDNTRLAYYEALMEYALNGVAIDDNVIVKSLLNLVKPQIEANNRKYENGKKGGRPRKETETVNDVKEAPPAAGDSDPGEITTDLEKPNTNQEKPNHNQELTKNNQTETKKNQTKPNETNPKPNVNVNVNDNDNVLKEKEKKEKSDAFSVSVCEKTIEYLNEKCGTTYDPENEELYKQIRERYKEGHTLDEFKAVIDKKSKEWLFSSMAKNLNPITLFKPIKFSVYLGETEKTETPVKVFPGNPSMMENGGAYSDMEELLIEN